ncbi:MAG: hypothetical protein ACLTC8_12230 [Lachnospiraceae bacterium]|jgi:hypothetical protein
MDYKDYIKAEYCDAYVQERDNLADRLIEAKYNLLFLNMVYERDVAYRNSNDSTERFEIRIILRRIYITVVWELVLQIKAFTDDKEKDCLTVDKFKNNIFRYIKDEKKQEYYDSLGAIKKEIDRSACDKLVARISEYRNKIIGHNMLDSPKLTFDIHDADFVISQYEKIFKVLNFQNESYVKRVADLDDEMASFITAYLDVVLPLN